MRRPTSAANYSARAAGSCSCSRSRARRTGCCSLTADPSSPRPAPPQGRSSLASPTWSPIWRHSPATPSCEEQNVSKYPEVKTADDFHHQPVEYQEAVRKIIRSHALNELYGAQVFDEPAIALAPTPYAKWLTYRVAMEEYHHHVRFKELADQIGVSADEMQPDKKRPLNIFEFPLQTWRSSAPSRCSATSPRSSRWRTCCTARICRCATWRASPCRRSAFTPSSAWTSAATCARRAKAKRACRMQ